MKKKEAKQIYKLLEQWTRAEIIARHGPFDNLEFGQYAVIKLEKEDEIRKLLYGTNNLIDLGIKWGILKERKKKRRTKKVKHPPMDDNSVTGAKFSKAKSDKKRKKKRKSLL